MIHSRKADMYAFAIVLWELLTWELPWEDMGTFQVRSSPLQWVCWVERVLHDHITTRSHRVYHDPKSLTPILVRGMCV
jgi:hypothetical protein